MREEHLHIGLEQQEEDKAEDGDKRQYDKQERNGALLSHVSLGAEVDLHELKGGEAEEGGDLHLPHSVGVAEAVDLVDEEHAGEDHVERGKVPVEEEEDL